MPKRTAASPIAAVPEEVVIGSRPSSAEVDHGTLPGGPENVSKHKRVKFKGIGPKRVDDNARLLDAGQSNIRILPYSSSKARRDVYDQKSSWNLSCSYQIKSEDLNIQKWRKMRNYKRFQNEMRTFEVNNDVFVNNNTGRDWVARILEIRAIDGTKIYARIFWYYWPDEIPDEVSNTDQGYHTSKELLVSNHMEIIDVTTINSIATVEHTKEPSPQAAEGLYWRHTFNVLTKSIISIITCSACGNRMQGDHRCLKNKCREPLGSDPDGYLGGDKNGEGIET